MGFKLYRLNRGKNLRENYDQPEKLLLSGLTGPIAAYALALWKSDRLNEWDLAELELMAMAFPEEEIRSRAILFDGGNSRDGHVTLYRLVSIHGRSRLDTTELIIHFKGLLINHPAPDPKAFHLSFSIDPTTPQPDIYENLQLSGGTHGGSWKWAESEQILNATTLGSGAQPPADSGPA